MHLKEGPGSWERARLRGDLRDVAHLAEIGLDHSPFGASVIRQLATFAQGLTPAKLKFNLRMGRPGQVHICLLCQELVFVFFQPLELFFFSPWSLLFQPNLGRWTKFSI